MTAHLHCRDLKPCSCIASDRLNVMLKDDFPFDSMRQTTMTSHSDAFKSNTGSRRILCRAAGSVYFVLLVLIFAVCSVPLTAQSDQTNPRHTEGDINDSALLTLGIPLGSYKGRGISLPVSLSYSSDLWKMEIIGKVSPGSSIWQSVNQAVYSKYAVSGWRSSLQLPVIEFPRSSSSFDYKGKSDEPSGGCFSYRVAEVYIHMPDGSTHTLRKTDQPFSGNVDMTGTFYAVDNSRMRFDANGTADTGTIYMPDGTKYILDYTTSYIYDRNGNYIAYDVATRTWTDTIGRTIAEPIPANPVADTTTYASLPGLSGVSPNGQLTYAFKWKLLGNALTLDSEGNTPALRVVGSEYLPNPSSPPSSSNFPVTQSSQYGRLFQSTPSGESGNGPVFSGLIVGKGMSGGQVFNPVVLKEIDLPDGTSYKFSYDVYGEIDKVIYPTNAYDKYEYSSYPPSLSPPVYEEGMDREEDQQPYLQSMRWISSRKQSVDGTGGDVREWTYINAPLLDGGGTTSIISPDKTRTEIERYGPGSKTGVQTGPANQSLVLIYPFGFRDSRAGMISKKKFYSTSADGHGGTLLREEAYQYDQTSQSHTITCQVGGQGPPASNTYTFYRTPRLTRATSFIFEGSGSALAQSTTYQYDLTNEYSTGIDQTLAATYQYVVVDNPIAQTGDLTQVSLGTLAKYSVSTYLNSSSYQGNNILGLPTSVEIRDGAGTVVSRSEMSYDDAGYVSSGTTNALPTTSKTWDSTKGLVTNPGSYLVTHATFDQYGNRTIATDAKGYSTTTTYDSTFHAFPVSVMSPIPNIDPNDVRGSTSAFTTSTTFDFTTGLVLSATDANGQTTTISYVDPESGIGDPLLRPRKVTAPNGQQTITGYGAGTDVTSRWVKVSTQIDGTNWSQAQSFYDGIGRTYKTQKTDSNGDIFSETVYDDMGRVEKSTNPYRSGETVQWTTPTYDDLGRIISVVSPDGSSVSTVYGLSTSGIIGATKVITDQAGRKRKGITDALGNMVRVIEDPESSVLVTDYVFDSLGNLRKTTQGEQNRYFMYDSLGRVMYAKQVEQDTNSSFSGAGFADPITGNNLWSVKYTYDDNGNIATTTDARNLSINANYDRLNRLTIRNYSDPATPDVNFYYDGMGLGTIPANSKGKTTKVASSVSENRYTSFDTMGRLLTSEQRTTAEQIAGTQNPYAFNYVYNLSGALMEETYPSGRVVKNTLDADGQLSHVESKKDANHGFSTYADAFTYNSVGAVTKMRLGNGLWETAVYDSKRLQVTQIGLGTTDGTQDLFKLEFSYASSPTSIDNNGSMREQKITVPTVGNNMGFTATQTYTYDSLNRIKSATENVSASQTWKQTFNYDIYGNRTFDTTNNNTTTITVGCSSAICNPSARTADNRFSSSDGYQYDAEGSVTQDATGQRFGYDSENRPQEFFSAGNAGSTPNATYSYDGEGKRVTKITGSEMTIFVYDASGQLAAEYSATVVSTETARVSYLTTDHLGSPRIITDQNGKVTSRKDFTAFGEDVISLQRTSGSDGNGYDPPRVRQDYTSYQKEEESNLEYAQTRYYNTAHGRFTSVDPLTESGTIRNPQTFNRYTYVINSPYKFVDPLGLTLMDAGIYLTSDPTLPGKFDRIWAFRFSNFSHLPPPPASNIAGGSNQTLRQTIAANSQAGLAIHPFNAQQSEQPQESQSATDRADYGKVISFSRQTTKWYCYQIPSGAFIADAGVMPDITTATIVYSPTNTGGGVKAEPLYGVWDGDHRGHIVSAALGMDGIDRNLTSQSATLNKGDLYSFEYSIRRTITDNQNWTVQMTVSIFYSPLGFTNSIAAMQMTDAQKFRPFLFLYSVRYTNPDGGTEKWQVAAFTQRGRLW